jgi:4-amino-4-deoxy-L-arabinose transferase-like glycosyltransferase
VGPIPDGASDVRPAVEGLGKGGAALLLALTAALLLFRLGAVPLIGPDEPRYVRVAVEMQRAGAWVTPTLAGEPWLEKPPLYYWLAGTAFRLLGETETAARLPSVAAALLLVGSTALFGARLFGRREGLHAGFLLATSLLPFLFGRAASMDMLLAALVTVAIGLAGLRLCDVAGSLAVPAAWAAAGLATLAKGPLGLLLPGIVALAFVGWTRDARGLRRLASPTGALLFAATALPWYALIYRTLGSTFVSVFLLNHNLERFTSTVHHHPGPFLYYLPVLLVGIFPWPGLVLPAAADLRPRRSRTDLFVLLWLVVPLAFFSAAGSKLPGYVLPCLPPLALLLGRAASRITQGRWPAAAWAGPRAVSLVGLAIASVVAAGPLLLYREGEPGWAALCPAAGFALLSVLGASGAFRRDPANALRLLRVGGAGLLVLLALGAPPILARRESGRHLFLPARGREVLVWGAWRTNWMAGYFYNDGRVREVQGLATISDAARSGPVLVLAGPSERRRLVGTASLESRVLATGSRGDTLVRVSPR